MSEFAGLFKDLNSNVKSTLVSLAIVIGFWVIPFMLFKPDFFVFPVYAQIALIFALGFVWYVSTFFASLHLMGLILTEEANPTPLLTICSIILLNISILISYYYSVSFTCFLRYAYGVLGVFFVVQFVLNVIIDYRKDNES
ncbi:hypothetical protein [Flavobacterium nitrogenifigens]|uniref:Uncharacterized protein n=1 Tax=Flavobacterium nitrogenifigens TaxID=1617283 RepID=A0A521AF55_9FLAO|nr:hypothetical protein [Flavobacterium nitrogenifigens]KAF2331489.1 hypothetical protein DM397_12185 [Flavobacterium nitrogenifigens]SMO33453.1 hypothetical protein SAMN06265220_10186 [Flavobacterium nitrogenifigens]